jgi:uncharacterized protein DUF6600/FecR-like protein
MTRALVAALPGFLLVAISSSPTAAQESTPPAHVAYVEGRAVLEHDTTSEDVEPNVPLEIGDRVRTESGRVEVLFGDGSLMHLDEQTTIDVLSDTLIRQLGGRVAIVAGGARAGRLQIDTPAGSVRIARAGEYRVGVFDQDGVSAVELAVMRGEADLVSDQGVVTVSAGTRALARGGEIPSQPMPFNSARWDAFDQWSQDRLAARRGADSAQYVPAPLQSYGTVLDANGAWNYEPTYGYVWFPHVATGWRPYYYGRWRYYGRFGWTWIGGPVWAWPTHHYGRWGITSAGGWFWIPGSTWGAAWVNWSVAPHYVSWCPLGFNGRPVVPFGYKHVGWGHHPYDPWRAWTVVNRAHFGGYRPVTHVAFDGRRLGAEGLRPFVSEAPPAARAAAGRRAPVDAASIRTADTSTPSHGIGVAVPRGNNGVVPRGGNGGEVSRGSALSPGATVPRDAGVAAARGTGTMPGQSAASRVWGRDMRWTTPRGVADPVTAQPADGERPGTVTSSPSSLRGNGSAGVDSRSLDGSRPVSVMPRRTAPVTGSGAVPRGSVSRGWSPDSVPVYRGGVLSGPGDRPLPRSSGEVTVRPSRRSEAGPAYAPRPSFASPPVPQGSVRPYLPPTPSQAPASGRRGPASIGPGPGAVYRAPTPPAVSASPGAGAPRQSAGSARGSVGVAVPRGTGAPTGAPPSTGGRTHRR